MRQEYKFIYKNDQQEIVVSTQEVTAQEIITAFRAFLLAAGFHPETVEAYVPAEH